MSEYAKKMSKLRRVCRSACRTGANGLVVRDRAIAVAAEADAEIARLRRAGALMSNVCFNLKQRTSLTLTEAELKCIGEAGDMWDTALSAVRASTKEAK